MQKILNTLYSLKFATFIGAIVVIFWLISFEQKLESSATSTELFSVSTFHSLNSGNYDGILSLGELKQHGSYGIGTFEAIDGEMIYYRDTMYQVLDSGEVVLPDDSLTTPFATVFHLDRTTSIDVSTLSSLQSIIETLNRYISQREFYAIVIEGEFDELKLRSISSQEKPYPLLVNAIEEQTIFEYSSITGAMVGVYAPTFVGELTVPGYHFHFISANGFRGGHVLDISLNSAEIYINQITSIRTVFSK